MRYLCCVHCPADGTAYCGRHTAPCDVAGCVLGTEPVES